MVARRAQLLVTLLHISLASASQISPVQVIGLQHQMVKLSNYLELPLPIQEVDWYFQTNLKPQKVAQFEDSHSRFYIPQFNNRLELSDNGTTLQIKNLKSEDSGEYNANIILKNGETRTATFSLMVYDTVPVPDIRVEYEKGTSKQCNATLQCLVPTNSSTSSSSLSYGWRYKQRDHDYLPYNYTGDIIQILVSSEFQGMEIQCVVQNPADRKNVSQQIRCEASDACRLYFVTISFLSFVMIAFIIVLAVIIWKRRRKGESILPPATREEADPSQDVATLEYFVPPSSENAPSSSSQTFSWDKRGDHPKPPQQKFETLYITLHQDQNTI